MARWLTGVGTLRGQAKLILPTLSSILFPDMKLSMSKVLIIDEQQVRAIRSLLSDRAQRFCTATETFCHQTRYF
ncbi:MAG: hypothetical protein HC886_12795 [Leptolyngbyaceae cyanobacterium SM1_1_3]|nr:hypothetical protein [Leptolyngbyaceae cyanobacterium SM1_1_3]NJM85303.1 hypothetical protein [Leptolyngbyaceae cyanobacterium RM2_2_21]NJN03219.1 hypothetical protein [Leptolyngbyaceae cyanobacterium RM1_1_2]NJO11886.1 hypothetical protein [Leptolyngbyaceae cyanobacterium SL_1_1]